MIQPKQAEEIARSNDSSKFDQNKICDSKIYRLIKNDRGITFRLKCLNDFMKFFDLGNFFDLRKLLQIVHA